MMVTILTALNDEDLNALISNISLYSNSQSKVSRVDLRSRDPKMDRIKQLSDTVLTPDGRKWFFEKAKGDIRKVQGGQKPMPPKTAATIASDLAKLAKGDKESGVAAAQKIMTFAKAGVDVSKQQQAWIGNAKAGERFLTQSVYFEITKMLKENNLSWSDLGMRVHLLEGTNKMFGISLI